MNDNANNDKAVRVTKEKIREIKHKRKQMLQELEERQPRKQDILKNQDIINAQMNMGDYKPKSDLSYEVTIKNSTGLASQRSRSILYYYKSLFL